MRLVTFALALLTVGSMASTVLLLGQGAWALLAAGGGLFLAGLCAAFVTEHASAKLLAVNGRTRPGSWMGRVLALAGGCVPMAVIIAVVYGSAHRLFDGLPRLLGPTEWLFGYGVATGPWTAFAMRTRLALRTLVGVHAYVGQLMFLILMLSVNWLGVTDYGSLALMLLVAMPPMTVGALLGLAGTDAVPVPAEAAFRRLAARHGRN